MRIIPVANLGLVAVISVAGQVRARVTPVPIKEENPGLRARAADDGPATAEQRKKTTKQPPAFQ